MTNDWQIGALYLKGTPGFFWTQPGGVGTTVYPQQVQSSDDLFSVVPFTELSGTYIGLCGHSFNSPTVWRDYDYLTGTSVALICCPLCSCLLRTIEPFESATEDSIVNAIITP